MLRLFCFGIGLAHIGAPQQVIDAGTVVVSQTNEMLQRNGPFTGFVGTVDPLIDVQQLRDLCLCQEMILPQIVQSFNMRSGRSLFTMNPFSNKTLNLAALATVLLTALLLFTPIRIAFGLVLLQPKQYFIAIGLFMIPLVVMELAKAFGLVKHHTKH